MAQESGEKTEQPTEKRRKDLRRKGVLARTPELTSWGGLLVLVAVAPTTMAAVVATYRDLIATMCAFMEDPRGTEVTAVVGKCLLTVVTTLAPLFATVVVFSLVANVAQTRGVTSFALLAPKWERVSPGKGLKRIFSVESLWGVAKSFAKVALLTAVAWGPVRDAAMQFVQEGPMSPQKLASVLGTKALAIVQVVALAGLAIAAVDFWFVRRKVRKQSLMSKEEIKQEFKETEGNPEVRARRKQLARRLAFEARQLSAVREATVVVVNPTHYAVAFTYDPQWGPPKVVARGVEGFALRIRREALDAGVPVVADPELARFLHASCKLHAAIGDGLFPVVALLLHFVDTVDRRRAPDGPLVPPTPLMRTSAGRAAVPGPVAAPAPAG